MWCERSLLRYTGIIYRGSIVYIVVGVAVCGDLLLSNCVSSFRPKQGRQNSALLLMKRHSFPAVMQIDMI